MATIAATTKAEYWVKKEAQSIFNSVRKNSNRKRIPVRLYCEDNKWYMTSRPAPKVHTIQDDIDNILKFWGNPKKMKNLNKQQKETTLRLLNKLNNICKQ